MKSALVALLSATLLFAACHPPRRSTGTNHANIAITEKYWKLVTLDGQPIPSTEEGQREAHFILKTDERRVTGSGGCNLINGTYELGDDNRIRFLNMLSTKMACAGSGMDTETRFLQALSEANKYVVIGETLTLYGGQKVLAVLNAVYLR